MNNYAVQVTINTSLSRSEITRSHRYFSSSFATIKLLLRKYQLPNETKTMLKHILRSSPPSLSLSSAVGRFPHPVIAVTEDLCSPLYLHCIGSSLLLPQLPTPQRTSNIADSVET